MVMCGDYVVMHMIIQCECLLDVQRLKKMDMSNNEMVLVALGFSNWDNKLEEFKKNFGFGLRKIARPWQGFTRNFTTRQTAGRARTL